MEMKTEESKAIRLEVMLKKALEPISEELSLIKQRMEKLESMQEEICFLLKEKNNK